MLQGYDHIELKPNGSNTRLTLDNVWEYLELTAHFTLALTVSPQVSAFREGFNTVSVRK